MRDQRQTNIGNRSIIVTAAGDHLIAGIGYTGFIQQCFLQPAVTTGQNGGFTWVELATALTDFQYVRRDMFKLSGDDIGILDAVFQPVTQHFKGDGLDDIATSHIIGTDFKV